AGAVDRAVATGYRPGIAAQVGGGRIRVTGAVGAHRCLARDRADRVHLREDEFAAQTAAAIAIGDHQPQLADAGRAGIDRHRSAGARAIDRAVAVGDVPGLVRTV